MKGKETGNYGCRINGKRVDLKTADYELARERAKLAMAGQPFANVVKGATAGPKSWASSDDWSLDLQDAAGQAPDETPTEEPEATPETSVDEGEKVDYLPPKKESEEPEPEPEASTTLPPEFMDGILDQAAAILVEVQIMGQEFMAKRWAKVQMGKVPYEGDASLGRKAGGEIWKQALRELVPTDVPLPPYLLAPLVVAAMTLPVQAMGASKIEPETGPRP